jgi:hypothetical protein
MIKTEYRNAYRSNEDAMEQVHLPEEILEEQKGVEVGLRKLVGEQKLDAGGVREFFNDLKRRLFGKDRTAQVNEAQVLRSIDSLKQLEEQSGNERDFDEFLAGHEQLKLAEPEIHIINTLRQAREEYLLSSSVKKMSGDKLHGQSFKLAQGARVKADLEAQHRATDVFYDASDVEGAAVRKHAEDLMLQNLDEEEKRDREFIAATKPNVKPKQTQITQLRKDTLGFNRTRQFEQGKLEFAKGDVISVPKRFDSEGGIDEGWQVSGHDLATDAIIVQKKIGSEVRTQRFSRKKLVDLNPASMKKQQPSLWQRFTGWLSRG